MEVERQLLSRREAAEYLGMSIATLRRLVIEGEIELVRVGSSKSTKKLWKFTRTALDHWIKRSQRKLGA